MPDYVEYDHTADSKIYPLGNRIKHGYGVADPDVNPAGNQANGLLVNQANQKIAFWVEDIVANFSMTGTTAQSRMVRQFIPHNVVQPYVTVTGRAPNSFELNRMASYVRASQFYTFRPRYVADMGLQRHQNINGQTSTVSTVRFVLTNNSSLPFPYNGSNVKGVHKPWALEGYIKSMTAGAQRFDQAPQFTFDFYIASSDTASVADPIAIWNDSQVNGSALRPWLDWIKKDGGYVTITDNGATTAADQHQQAQGNGNSLQDIINAANSF